MGARGRQQSAERVELESVACTGCGAAPGGACLTPSGEDQGSKLAHAARWRALKARRLAALRR